MKLTDLLTPDCVRVPLLADCKTAAITELVDLLYAGRRITNRDAVLATILEREAAQSTAIGQGLAVPHGKSTSCTQLVMALGKPSKPLDFDSIDGRPVSLIVLLASPPDQIGPHIQALKQVAQLMMIDGFRAAMQNAITAEEAYQIIRDFEK